MTGSIGVFTAMVGAAQWLNGHEGWRWVMFAGLAIVIYMTFGWFAEQIRESRAGKLNDQVDMSYRMGMSWFIFSEVMFFAAFFGALYYARQYSVPWLGGEGSGFFTNFMLWDGFESTWPTNGPADVGGAYEKMGALGLPAINTAILLTSSVTVTIAHHALIAGNRKVLNAFLALTVLLGALFLGLQVYEYIHAYEDLNLTLGTGIYGSTFFMLTGFHGAHVTLGTIMLTVILFRCLKGHFSPEKHFGFEAVAWYWHFVDVVWVGLYIFVYWL